MHGRGEERGRELVQEGWGRVREIGQEGEEGERGAARSKIPYVYWYYVLCSEERKKTHARKL